MTRTIPDSVPLSSDFHVTPAGGQLTLDVGFYLHQVRLQCGSSVKYGLQPCILQDEKEEQEKRNPLGLGSKTGPHFRDKEKYICTSCGVAQVISNNASFPGGEKTWGQVTHSQHSLLIK
ncbi:hypothetical protein AVEN_154124-1 [Araneus ventricosus]|uniref:Uncharacterized protein n=1 Tax=Araneus ventricosus TaxID=182803 RepID=A0A4Y2PQJ3_ARAVE|nr:hypothetical protein AVEN_154124-1 [Araneus ventricosus]